MTTTEASPLHNEQAGVDASSTTEQAQRAVKAFRAMQPGLTSFARVLTGRREVRVQLATGGPRTDGTHIFYRPPIALGSGVRHSRSACDQRDEASGVQLCSACAVREEVMIQIYHEISHIAFGTFSKVEDRDKGELINRALQEYPSKYAERIKERISLMPERDQKDYLNLSKYISPFLPPLINALEDVRIDNAMFRARKGTKKMFDAMTTQIFIAGIETDDGSFIQWRDQPPNAQITVGVFCLGSEYDYRGWFSEEVEEALNDATLQQLVTDCVESTSNAEVYRKSFSILARLRELGFLRNPEDEEDEDDGPGDNDDLGDSSDTDDSADDSGDDSEQDDDEDSESSDQEEVDNEDDSGPGEPSPDSDEDSGSEEDEQADSSDTTDEGDGEADESDRPSDAEESESSDEGENDSESGESQNQGEPEEASSSDDEDSESEQTEDDASSGEGEVREGSEDAENGDEQGDVDESSADGGDDSQESGSPGESGDYGERDLSDSRIEDTGTPGHQEAWDDPDDDGPQPDAAESSQDDGQPTAPDDEELIDSGADEGKGGATAETVPQGTPTDVSKAIEVLAHHGDIHDFDTHSEGSPSNSDTTQEQSAVDTAIVQGLYFETPSIHIEDVKIYRYENREQDNDNQSYAWRFSDETGEGLDEFEKANLRRAGQFVEMDIPEQILGPATLESRRAFNDNLRAIHEKNLRAGKVRNGALGKRAWSGDERLFQRNTIPGKKSYSVLIGIDISMSTVGENLALSKRAAWAQAELCNRLGIDFAIWAHSTGSHMAYNYDTGIDTYTMDMYEIKSFDEEWTTDTKERLETIAPVAGNLDGHSVEFYRKLVEQRPTTDKIVMYYTDGKMPAANHDEELEILQREIRYCKSRGITLMGVGIRTDSPKAHGLDTCEVNTDEDLVGVVRHLSKRLDMRR